MSVSRSCRPLATHRSAHRRVRHCRCAVCIQVVPAWDCLVVDEAHRLKNDTGP